MKTRIRRAAMLAAALAIGGLMGFAVSQSENRLMAQADPSNQSHLQLHWDHDGAQGTPTEQTRARKPQRFGSVIGLKADKKDYYNKLHAEPWPEINSMIKKCNIQNYSIYEVELDGKLYLFSYFEYTGDDFEADMAKMAADPKMCQWWAETDPCQIRLPGTPEGEQWLKIPEVYHLD